MRFFERFEIKRSVFNLSGRCTGRDSVDSRFKKTLTYPNLGRVGARDVLARNSGHGMCLRAIRWPGPGSKSRRDAGWDVFHRDSRLFQCTVGSPETRIPLWIRNIDILSIFRSRNLSPRPGIPERIHRDRSLRSPRAFASSDLPIPF